ncbi:MAG: 30S ribosome-binding factor RbfA [Chlorobi bacterium]|nr:30S ribosome-binding factor RbfA [Chlorobiota bacterium]
MESNRQKKVSRLIQKELGEIFRKESLAHFEGKMISVTVVRISADLSLAKVYLSIFPTVSEETFSRLIFEKKRFIRYQLSQVIRNQVRIIPELVFYPDDSLDYIDNIDRILKS